MPWPAPTTTFAKLRVRPMKGNPSALIGREPAQASKRSSQSRSRNLRIERTITSTRRPSNGGDPTELHRAAEADAVLERRRHRVHLLEDDRLAEQRRWSAGRRCSPARPPPPVAVRGAGPAPRRPAPAASTSSATSTSPSAMRSRRTRSPTTSKPVMVRCSSSWTPRDRSTAINESTKRRGSAARLPGSTKPALTWSVSAGTRRRTSPPSSSAPGPGTPSAPMCSSSAWKRSASRASWNGTTISPPAATSTPLAAKRASSSG